MIMNWLGKMFKKKKKGYNMDCTHKLLIIDDKEELLHKILGISEKRCEIITEVCINAYKGNDQLHSCLEEVVGHCKHTNEVVFATLICQRVIEKMQSKDRVLDLLKNMFGNG
jgi:hypothetical protein